MDFQEAVGRTPHLRKAYKSGLQALRSEDRPHIVAEDTRRISGSAYIDEALKKADPYGNRRDFAIAYRHSNRNDEVIYWVELHTASDSQVNLVIRKAQWLLEWLRNGGKLLAAFRRDIVWLSSGATTFTLNAPQRKRMAEAGLQHRGRLLRIYNRRNSS